MLSRVDRIQVTSRDRRETARPWRRLLDAEVVREDVIKELAARRSVLRVGTSEVEILEADGPGPVAENVSAGGGGLFAVGLATPDLAALRAHLGSQGVRYGAEGEQLFMSGEDLGIPGLRVVVSADRERQPEGLLRHLYEATHLTPDFAAASAGIAQRFALDASHFVPIRSERYGYDGTLTLFDPERLDRIETVQPFALDKTMGRFFDRRGPCLYMSYAESDEMGAIRERLLEQAPDDWTGEREGAAPDGLFIHPKALGGLLLGVSRTTFAWTWSGSPDRVQRSASA
jgi:hypothetical protein